MGRKPIVTVAGWMLATALVGCQQPSTRPNPNPYKPPTNSGGPAGSGQTGTPAGNPYGNTPSGQSANPYGNMGNNKTTQTGLANPNNSPSGAYNGQQIQPVSFNTTGNNVPAGQNTVRTTNPPLPQQPPGQLPSSLQPGTVLPANMPQLPDSVPLPGGMNPAPIQPPPSPFSTPNPPPPPTSPFSPGFPGAPVK